jgi:LmbE family N-acetylglucosaminyl deacetylase
MEFTNILSPIARLFKPSKLSLKNPTPFTIMILSPHPDDESIVGSLAIRLMKENNCHVVNVAVTLGSNKNRQAQRIKELNDACELLSFECVYLHEDWKIKEKELKSLIQKYQPKLIIAPHLKDFHPAHIKTGQLCQKVLTSLKKETLLVAWSEFWGQMNKPNLLVEVPLEILEEQMKALEKHVGEVARNPYHLRLPSWMMDNVRRGSEVVCGKGSASASMAFGVLYKLQLVKSGKFFTPKGSENILYSETDIGHMFKLILDAASGSSTKVK